jgi:hypothetical protein
MIPIKEIRTIIIIIIISFLIYLRTNSTAKGPIRESTNERNKQHKAENRAIYSI